MIQHLKFTFKCFGQETGDSCPPVSTGDTPQDPQWLPETSEGTKPCTCCVFFLCIHDKV